MRNARLNGKAVQAFHADELAAFSVSRFGSQAHAAPVRHAHGQAVQHGVHADDLAHPLRAEIRKKRGLHGVIRAGKRQDEQHRVIGGPVRFHPRGAQAAASRNVLHGLQPFLRRGVALLAQKRSIICPDAVVKLVCAQHAAVFHDQPIVLHDALKLEALGKLCDRVFHHKGLPPGKGQLRIGEQNHLIIGSQIRGGLRHRENLPVQALHALRKLLPNQLDAVAIRIPDKDGARHRGHDEYTQKHGAVNLQKMPYRFIRKPCPHRVLRADH